MTDPFEHAARTDSTARARLERQSRAQRIRIDPTLAPHGVGQTYRNWMCRCAECTAAHTAECTAYKRERRAATAGGDR